MGFWRRVLVVVALALLVGVAAACGKHAAQSSPKIVVQSFQMVNAQVGWAVGEGSGGTATSVLRTTDGGVHWVRVFGGTHITATDFLDATHAWVMGLRGPFVVQARTADGGTSWQGIASPHRFRSLT